MTRGVLYCLIMALSINPFISYKEKVIESFLFLIAIVLGNGALLAFKASKRVVKVKELFLSFVIAMFVGAIIHITATNFQLYNWRFLFVLSGAFLSEWILKWVESRFPKIFDGVFKRATGIDLNNQNQNDTNDNGPTT